MKKKILFLVVIAVMSCKDKPKETQNEMKEERETQIEDNNEWTVLFDGSSFDGWHFYQGESSCRTLEIREWSNGLLSPGK